MHGQARTGADRHSTHTHTAAVTVSVRMCVRSQGAHGIIIITVSVIATDFPVD